MHPKSKRLYDKRFRNGYRELTVWECDKMLERIMRELKPAEPGKGYRAPTFYNYQFRNGFHSKYAPCYKYLPDDTYDSMKKRGLK